MNINIPFNSTTNLINSKDNASEVKHSTEIADAHPVGSQLSSFDPTRALEYALLAKKQLNETLAAQYVGIYQTHRQLEVIGGSLEYDPAILALLGAAGGELPMVELLNILPDRAKFNESRDRLQATGKIAVTINKTRKMLNLVQAA